MGALLARLRWRRPTTPAAVPGPEATEDSKDEFRGETNEYSYNSPLEETSVPLPSEERKDFRPLEENTEKKILDDSAAQPDLPEAKEVQRVQETVVEKEKTIADSGATTEKTVYTQYTESMKIQESKGPIADPFESPQHKTMFPSSFTEFNVTPKSPCSEKEISITHPIDEVEEQDSNISDAVVKIQAGVRGYLTRKALKENRKEDIPLLEESSDDLVEVMRSKVEKVAKDISENLIQKFRDASVERESQNAPILEVENSKPKALIDFDISPKDILIPPKIDSKESKAPITFQEFPSYAEVAEKDHAIPEEDKDASPPLEEESDDADSPLIANVLSPSLPESHESDIQDEDMLEDEILDDDEKEAATKIQAAFRGYKVRKHSKRVKSSNSPGSAKVVSFREEHPASNLLEKDLDTIQSSSVKNIMDTQVGAESLPTAMTPLLSSIDTLSDAAIKSVNQHFATQPENYSETHLTINEPRADDLGSYIIGGSQISGADQIDLDDLEAEFLSSRPVAGSETHHQSA